MNKLKYFITFLNLSGFSLVLAITAITLGLENSTRLTYPTKALTILLMLTAIGTKLTKLKFNNRYIIIYFIFFAFYINKLFIELIYPNPNLLNSISMISLYIVAHSFLPFLFYLFLINRNDYETIFKALFLSSFLFNIAIYFIYGKLLIYGVGRLGDYQTKHFTEEATLSPLVLAYNATITIVLSVFSLITHKTNRKSKMLYYFAIIIAMPAFLLGASRGAIIGLILSYFSFFLLSRRTSKFKLSFLIFILASLIIAAATFYQSSVLVRFTSLFEENFEENLRFLIYKTTFQQFLESPLIGGSIQNDTVNHFPHNIYLEALTATGVFGFLALFYLTIKALRNVFYIFKKDVTLSWIGILFLVYFVHSLFNATIYGAVGFWMFLGLLLGYKRMIYETHH